MKILNISTDRKIFEDGSAVRARMVEYAALFDELHIVIFSTRGQSKNEKLRIADNCWVYPTNSLSRWSYIFDAARIGKKIIENPGNNFAVSAQDPFECGLAAYMISMSRKIPLHLQIHVDFLSPYFRRLSFLNGIRVFIASFLIPKANSIRVVSQRIKDSLQTKNYKLKTSPIVLPIFTDLKKITESNPSFDLKKKYPQWDFIVLVAARFTPEKNIGFALNVLKDLLKTHPKIGLVIVGEGPLERSLKLKVESLKIQNNVIFENWQTDLISYYKTADLFLCTSLYEGFGLTLLEAAVSGCPTVSSDVGIAPELLKFKEKSFVCPVGDLRCFVDKSLEFVEDKQLREFFRKELVPAEIAKFNLSKAEYLEKYRASLVIQGV